MKEQWKDVLGFEGYYQVSNFGRVKSFDRVVKVEDKVRGKYLLKIRGKLLKNIKATTGYAQVNLYIRKKSKVCNVHRLVATHFIPNSENKPQVNHKDGNKMNCHIDNLEWMTSSENGIHGYRVLKYKAWHKGNLGKNTPTAKIVSQKDLMGNTIKIWDCASDAVRELGCDSGCITKVCQGINKSHKGFIWSYGE